ncbi:MAG: hypothetical protein JOZ87_38175 [Chloroflexi bacterium]|nr:hypothetical protein [Chloroflexota bacterium]
MVVVDKDATAVRIHFDVLYAWLVLELRGDCLQRVRITMRAVDAHAKPARRVAGNARVSFVVPGRLRHCGRRGWLHGTRF